MTHIFKKVELGVDETGNLKVSTSDGQRWKDLPDSIPQDWSIIEHDPPDGKQDLDMDGNCLIGGLLKDPGGFPAFVFDATGRREIYHADGQVLAIVVHEDGDINIRAQDGTDIATWHEAIAKWEFVGDVIYRGNNPLLLDGGGLDAGNYEINRVNDPIANKDAANKQWVLAQIAEALGP